MAFVLVFMIGLIWFWWRTTEPTDGIILNEAHADNCACAECHSEGTGAWSR